ncbi:MAG: hypothetical protein QXU70_05430, partial [Thermoplasmatales archaeon]
LLQAIPPGALRSLESLTFIPTAIGPAFKTGLSESLYFAIGLTLIGALLSALRGGKYVHEDSFRKDRVQPSNGLESINRSEGQSSQSSTITQGVKK